MEITNFSECAAMITFYPYIDINRVNLPLETKLETADILHVLSWTERSSRIANLYLEKSIQIKNCFRIVEYVFPIYKLATRWVFFARDFYAPIKMDLVTSALINMLEFMSILSKQGCLDLEVYAVEKSQASMIHILHLD
jgi:hypothetical protein